jgi:uncharacterized metal-binding protein YceD (DUF177 family)
MATEIALEFSRLVSLARLGSEPFRQRIEATPNECARLSQRFHLVSLDRLAATVELRRQGAMVILLEAAFEAEFVQTCVVTLDPVAGAISDRFSLVYGPPELAPREITPGRDEAAFEPLTADAIDIGEAVAQELSLALPAFPRHPEAIIDVETSAPTSGGAFALLARLRRSRES